MSFKKIGNQSRVLPGLVRLSPAVQFLGNSTGCRYQKTFLQSPALQAALPLQYTFPKTGGWWRESGPPVSFLLSSTPWGECVNYKGGSGYIGSLGQGKSWFQVPIVFATSLLATVQKHPMEKFICFPNGNRYL